MRFLVNSHEMISNSQNRLRFPKLFTAHTKCLTNKSFSTSCPQSTTAYTNQLEGLHQSGVQFGQPTQFTHPHLLQPNELTIGLLPTEFAERRERLMERIAKHCVDFKRPQRNMVNSTYPQANSVKFHLIVSFSIAQVIIPASPKKYMTGKIPYFFRQNTDFFYLTGCLEPDSVLVLWTNEKNQFRSTLFLRPKNSHDELWDGPRTGDKYAIDFFGIDEAYPLIELPQFVGNFINETGSFNIWYDYTDEIQSNVTAMVQSHLPDTKNVESPMKFLHELRLIKSPAEINLMRKTCEIASEAINKTMQNTKPGERKNEMA